MLGSFPPELLVVFTATSLLRSEEPTLSCNQFSTFDRLCGSVLSKCRCPVFQASEVSGSLRFGYMLPLDSSMPGGQVWISRVLCRIVDVFSLEQHSPQVCSVSTSRHRLLRPSRRRTPDSSSSVPSLDILHKSAHWFPC